MKMLRKVLFIFVIANNGLLAQNNSSSALISGNIKFDHLTIEDGLANSTIRHIIQDKKGFLWFAALNALCRYDGYEFKTYKYDHKNPNSLSGDRITALIECEEGYLLVGTWQMGMDLFDPVTEIVKHYRYNKNDSSSIGSNQVSTIYIDKLNRIWIGAGNALNLFNKEENIFKRYYLGEDDMQILSITEYNNGELWICTNQLRMFKLDIDNELFVPLNIIHTEHIVPFIWSCKLYVDSNDILWICSVKYGLYRYDQNTKKIENFRHNPDNPNSLSHNDVFDIIEDADGKYWIATDGGGLNYFDYHSKKFYSFLHDPFNPASISTNKPYCLAKDKTNIIWIGTYNSGVNKYDRNKEKFVSFKNIPNNKNSLSNNIVWSFCQDRDGDIWIGTDGGGINLYNPSKYGEQFIRYTHNENEPASFPSNSSITIYQDSREIIWIGTYNQGLIRFNKKKNTFTSILAKENKPDSRYYPAGNNAWDIEEDSLGRLWIATLRYGVDVFDPVKNKFRHYRIDNSNLSNDEVTTICRDSKNRMWLGTAAGLNLYNSKKDSFVVFTHNNYPEMPGDNIRVIYEDKNDNLWIGTEGFGLSLFNTESFSFTNFSEDDGLPSNIIYGILEDDQDNLWISTSGGLTRFNTRTKIFRKYTQEEGLQSIEFKQNSCMKTSDGRMFFGGIEGFTIFHPDSIKDNMFIPPVILTELLIFNKPVKIGTEDSPLTQDISITESITLSYRQSVFGFEYTALNFTIPEKNQYAYMMEGFDKSWHYVGSKREATYTNLDPGEYIFRVKASNNDGRWNEEGTSVRISILPPWWRTLLFRILAVIFISGIITTIILLRIDNLKHQRKTLEQKVEQRTLDLKHLNEELIAQKEEIQQQSKTLAMQRNEIQLKSETLEKAYNKIKILNNFGQELTNILNLEAINNMIYDYVSSLLDASVFGIGMYDESSESIVFSSFMEGGIPVPEFHSTLDDPTSCAAWCFKNQKIIISNDYENEYKIYISELKIRSSKIPKSLIYLPLSVKNKKIGILTLQSYNKNAYTENDIQTLQTLASYIAIALDNANAYDIVRTQKEELELHHSNLEKLVKERTNDLESAKIKAEESDRLKSAFLANMSHEIRTPLNAIVGFAYLLISEEYTKGSKDEILQIIERNTTSLLNLINDIIDFSKIESGEINISISEIDLRILLNEIKQTCLEEIKRVNKEDDLELVLNIDTREKIPVIFTDSIRLRQIFNNLISNAIKYTEKGYIEFGYKGVKDKFITFYVKDTGIGIDKKDYNIIFERFRKIEDGTHAVYRGTGLGLSITKYLIELLGGEIWLESEPGKGSEFMFKLPVETFHEESVTDIAKPDISEMPIMNWRNKKVLVVEDEISNFQVIKFILKLTNIEIFWAKNGEEAIKLFKDNKTAINLVLMDIKLPRRDGIDVAKELKKINNVVPIIAQTAYALPEEEHRIRNADFDEYLAKPITKNKLLSLMAVFLE